MCKNVDTLIKDDSTCIVDESFIREFIMFNIELDSFKKLLPKLQWNDFDIQLNTLNEDKLSAMISLRFLCVTNRVLCMLEYT